MSDPAGGIPENFDYLDLEASERNLVDGLGFFKYGNLMSDSDVRSLGTGLMSDGNVRNSEVDKRIAGLKYAYESLKIKKGSIMDANVSEIEILYGALPSYKPELVEMANKSSR